MIMTFLWIQNIFLEMRLTRTFMSNTHYLSGSVNETINAKSEATCCYLPIVLFKTLFCVKIQKLNLYNIIIFVQENLLNLLNICGCVCVLYFVGVWHSIQPHNLDFQMSRGFGLDIFRLFSGVTQFMIW